MKIRADEHVSRRIIRAIQEVALSKTFELTHVRDVHERRTADETWIPRFASEGGKAILSGDRRIRARPHQILALQKSGLVSIFLPAEWANSHRGAQAALLLYWWSKIEAKIAEATPGECWLVPFDFSKRDLVEFSISYNKVSSVTLR